jgi:UDP-2,3-diacylglucosamine hydrolase
MLALIAGTGALPGILLKRLRGQGVVLCEMAGFPVDVPADVPAAVPRLRFRIETLGTMLADLRARGATQVCFAGAVRRPPVDPAAIDDATLALVPRLQAAMQKGDDGTLREVIAIFEEAGFAIRAAHDLAPDLLPPAGVPSAARPSVQHMQDAVRAEAVLRAMALADVGQACVIRDGQAIAIEAAPGTDWMLQSLIAPDGGGQDGAVAASPVQPGVQAQPASPSRDSIAPRQGSNDPMLWAVDTASDLVAGWADWLGGEATPQGETLQQRPSAPRSLAANGVFFKAPKPGQDRRVDLPTIGPDTMAAAAQAGLGAVVVEAGGVMILDLPQVLQIADKHGIVLWIRPKGTE